MSADSELSERQEAADWAYRHVTGEDYTGPKAATGGAFCHILFTEVKKKLVAGRVDLWNILEEAVNAAAPGADTHTNMLLSKRARIAHTRSFGDMDASPSGPIGEALRDLNCIIYALRLIDVARARDRIPSAAKLRDKILCHKEYSMRNAATATALIGAYVGPDKIKRDLRAEDAAAPVDAPVGFVCVMTIDTNDQAPADTIGHSQ